MILNLKRRMPSGRAAFSSRTLEWALALGVIMLGWNATMLSQKASQESGIAPKYDVHTETKAKGTVEEVNQLPLGAKKDLMELIVKLGENKIHIYLCPKTFEDEMGISFNKGDEIAVTGSKVKQDETEVILARELVRGTDTLVLRDEKGNPVWNPRTGK